MRIVSAIGCLGAIALLASCASTVTFRDPAESLAGLRIEVPCANPKFNQDTECHWDQGLRQTADPDWKLKREIVRAFTGRKGAMYDVTLHVRGVVEPKNFTGGTVQFDHFQTGGTPVKNDYNFYSLHVSDPEAFFLPIDCTNERWDELGNHPEWSFHGKDFPSHQELMAARDRVLARHPKTLFVGLHVGHNAENLELVSQSLDRFPNFTVETGARIGELGRQPRTARRFFEKHQDRIFFGTDAIPPPAGERTPQQVFKDELYEIYYRFLETEDEYFDYAPAPAPPQGRWRIYGIGLPDGILKKVYHENAERLLGLKS